MAEASMSGALTDEHIVKLSKKITCGQELLGLGIEGLNLPDEVNAALYNEKEIQIAAYKVLQIWFKQQTDGRHAYTALYTALQKCKMIRLASELRKWVHGSTGSLQLPTERLQKIQDLTKESLLEKPFSTAKSKIWTLTPSSIPLDEIYTKLSLVKKDRKFGATETEELSDITQVLSGKHVQKKGPVRVLASGSGGNGKSTAMKHLARIWAEGSSKELENIDFIFHVALNLVETNEYIENIIIEQHKGLKDKSNNVQPSEVKAILQNHAYQVVILLDGHDEYKHGTNNEIDGVIKKEYLRHCSLVLTSRETEILRDIREYTDIEVEITGFDNQGVEEYASKFLGSPEKCDELLETADRSEINNCMLDYGILHIPIFLHMICVLFQRGVSILKEKVTGFSKIVKRCIDWETLRNTGQRYPSDVKNAIVVKLGKLAMRGLQRKRSQQKFTKNEIVQLVGEEAFELGLLVATECDPLEEEQTLMFCFRHLLFQEFTAGKFVATSDGISLERLFSSWDAVKEHQEVFKFACGLTDSKEDVQRILEFIYKKLIEYILQQTDIPEYLFDYETEFLKLLQKEIPAEMKIDPLHNKYINYVTKSDTKVFIPNQVYFFGPGIHSHEKMKYQVDRSLLRTGIHPAECLMKLEDEDADEILRVLRCINKYQKVHISNLDWKHVVLVLADEDDLRELVHETLTISRNITSIRLFECTIYRPEYEHIVTQLHHCTKLRRLDLGECIKMDIGGIVAAATALTELYLYECRFTSEVFKDLAKKLQRHTRLERLHLNSTRGIPAEMGAAVAGMKSLREVYVNECYMGNNTTQSLIKGLAKCHSIEDLRLRNNKLTDCVKILFPSANHPGFICLRRLWINNTRPNKADIEVLSRAIRSNQIPVLEGLDLSYNKMTGTLRNLLCGAEHPGFPCLKYLGLAKTKPNKEDLVSIREAVNHSRLPKLRNLGLGKNKFSSMKRELKNLATVSAKKYEKFDLKIYISSPGLSENFFREMEQLCQGTVIALRFLKK